MGKFSLTFATPTHPKAWARLHSVLGTQPMAVLMEHIQPDVFIAISSQAPNLGTPPGP